MTNNEEKGDIPPGIVPVKSKFGRTFYFPADGNGLPRLDIKPDDKHLQPVTLEFKCPKCETVSDVLTGAKIGGPYPAFRQLHCGAKLDADTENERACGHSSIIEIRVHEQIPDERLITLRVPQGFHTYCFNCTLLRKFTLEPPGAGNKREMGAQGAFIFKCAINLCRTVEEWFILNGFIKLNRRQRLGRWIHGSKRI